MARGCGALLGAVALAAALPATAFAERDDRHRRNERHFDHDGRGAHVRHGDAGRHGRYSGHPAFRHGQGAHRHGRGCSHASAYHRGHPPHRPYLRGIFLRSGWPFGR
jgi:hypothetical protein